MSEHRKEVFAKSGIDNATAIRIRKSDGIRKGKRESVFDSKRKMLSVMNEVSSTTTTTENIISQGLSLFQIILLLMSKDLKESIYGLQCLRQYSCSAIDREFDENSDSINQIFDVQTGWQCSPLDLVIQYIVYYKNESVQSDAAWCVINLSAHCITNFQLAHFLPVIPICLQLISASNTNSTATLKEQCCWAIGNIVSQVLEDQSVSYSKTPVNGLNNEQSVREIVIANGALYIIIEYLYYTMIDLQQQYQLLYHPANTANRNISSRKSPADISNTIIQLCTRLQTIFWVFCNLLRSNESKGVSHSITGEQIYGTIQTFMQSIRVMEAPVLTYLQLLYTIYGYSLSQPLGASLQDMHNPHFIPLNNAWKKVHCEITWVFVYFTTREDDFITYLVKDAGLGQVLIQSLLSLFECTKLPPFTAGVNNMKVQEMILAIVQANSHTGSDNLGTMNAGTGGDVMQEMDDVASSAGNDTICAGTGTGGTSGSVGALDVGIASIVPLIRVLGNLSSNNSYWMKFILNPSVATAVNATAVGAATVANGVDNSHIINLYLELLKALLLAIQVCYKPVLISYLKDILWLSSNTIAYVTSDEYISKLTGMNGSNITDNNNLYAAAPPTIYSFANTPPIQAIPSSAALQAHYAFLYSMVQVILSYLTPNYPYIIQKEACICLHNCLLLGTNPLYNDVNMPIHMNHIAGIIMNHPVALKEMVSLLRSKYTDALCVVVLVKLLYTLATTWSNQEQIWLNVLCNTYQLAEVLEDVETTCMNTNNAQEGEVIYDTCHYAIEQLYHCMGEGEDM